jgi:hypothetical protein
MEERLEMMVSAGISPHRQKEDASFCLVAQISLWRRIEEKFVPS